MCVFLKNRERERERERDRERDRETERDRERLFYLPLSRLKGNKWIGLCYGSSTSQVICLSTKNLFYFVKNLYYFVK